MTARAKRPVTRVDCLARPGGPVDRHGRHIPLGVIRIVRRRQGAPPLVVWVDPPDAALLDVDFDSLDADQIRRLGNEE